MLSSLLSSLQPVQNPIGFGASDFLEFVIAALLVALALVWRPWIAPVFVRLAPKTRWCMLLLAATPVVLRLLLLWHHPAPSPDVRDEFGHLFVADTLRHLRLSNPEHPMRQFFETAFILQEPTFSSIYPIGQGLMLAVGRMFFGHPWAGVVLATAAFAALCYWMLLGWTTPEWSLAGGLLAIFEFGPLCLWMNDYWGGALPAAAGCLIFGALPRLAERGRRRDAALLGVGFAIHLLTRPFESIFLFAGVLVFFAPMPARLLHAAPVVVLAVMPALGITLLQNKLITGQWMTLPYQLSQRQYGVPAPLTFQPDPIPRRDLTRQQQQEYESQRAMRGTARETLESYLLRLEYRVRFYRFFFLAPLYLAIPAFFFAARNYRYACVLLTLLILALGVNFFPALQFHYLAGVTCLFVLIGVVGLQQISRVSPEGARLIFFLCAASFVFWYGMHIFETQTFSFAMRRYETWDSINHRNPERRIEVNRELARIPGQLLVFVRYWPQHSFQDEWVYNEADPDRARIVWARDLGEQENRKLRAYYPSRAVWMLEPDASPPRLNSYEPE